MVDIRKEELYIKNITRAVVSKLTKRYIPTGKPREDDVFIYTIAGSCAYETDDGTAFVSQPGDIAFLSRGLNYAMNILTEEYHYIPCVFTFDTQKPCKSLLIRPKDPAAFDSLFRRLAKHHSIAGPGQKQLCMGLLYQICAAILQNEQKDYMPGTTRLRIENARAYIQSHITQSDLRVAQLAKMANMSEVHFRKLFSAVYKLSPSAYILRERVHYARELMTLNELRLEDIAVQSGFSSLAHMCKVFKAVLGVSPGTCRSK